MHFQAWRLKVWGDLSPWDEDKCAFGQVGMGNGESLGADLALAVGKEVDVEGTRAPMDCAVTT